MLIPVRKILRRDMHKTFAPKPVNNSNKIFSEIGNTFDGVKTVDEALSISKLNWQVAKQPLFSQNKKQLPVNGIFRQDTGTFLGSCGSWYEPIQNNIGLQWANVFLPSDKAQFIGAGEIDFGRRVYAVARIPEYDFTVGKTDRSEGYLIFETSHDGKKSANIKMVLMRLICLNGVVKQLNSKDVFISIKHTKSSSSKMSKRIEEMQTLQYTSKNMSERFNSLAKKQLSSDNINNILSDLFGKDCLTSENWRKKEQLAKIAELFRSNDNNAFPEQKGTAYNLFNSITNYVDHGRKMKTDTVKNRLESGYFGTGTLLKEKALLTIEKEMESVDEILNSVNTAPSIIDDILSKVAV